MVLILLQRNSLAANNNFPSFVQTSNRPLLKQG